MKLGYSESVSKKIINNEPKIAAVLASGKVPKEIKKSIQYRRAVAPTTNPVTIYRGISVAPEYFDIHFIPNYFANPNEIFVTPHLKEAAYWPSLKTRTESPLSIGKMPRNTVTIIEYEVPDYLIYRGRHQDILYTEQFNGHENFIKRIGEISIEDAIHFDINKSGSSQFIVGSSE